jgi:hypothetical protein
MTVAVAVTWPRACGRRLSSSFVHQVVASTQRDRPPRGWPILLRIAIRRRTSVPLLSRPGIVECDVKMLADAPQARHDDARDVRTGGPAPA